ncbi:phage head-tail connector protein [Paucilactobacillus kaifaensis]|uniref:phage head-tail connector protein n=1 Tax=Paucilactobacillus kaifaensis TaxID=2559921 RepID=UPI0010F5CFB7|nr:phage head-tail connector protein [Paucilactobacillus kaifaensis]
MDELALLKANLGINSELRDTYLESIIKSVKNELISEKGIDYEPDNPTHLMFMVDYAAWRFRNRGEGAMPRNLQYRLHNLIIHNGGDSNV